MTRLGKYNSALPWECQGSNSMGGLQGQLQLGKHSMLWKACMQAGINMELIHQVAGVTKIMTYTNADIKFNLHKERVECYKTKYAVIYPQDTIHVVQLA